MQPRKPSSLDGSQAGAADRICVHQTLTRNADRLAQRAGAQNRHGVQRVHPSASCAFSVTSAAVQVTSGAASARPTTAATTRRKYPALDAFAWSGQDIGAFHAA